MADDKVPEPEPEDESAGSAPPPLNREERRRRKFGHAHDQPQDNRRLQSLNNTAFTNPVRPDRQEGPREAVAQSTTQGPSDMTGPGTGGATESEGQVPHHSGVHIGNPTKG